jgi:DnaK suppressor protein
MNPQELEKFKALLLHEQQELMGLAEEDKEATRPVALDQSSVGRLSRMDAMQSQAMAQETARRRKVQLVRIKAALERIEEGEYGYCAVCDEDINIKRLEVDPAAPFCVSCASAV